jgi:nucleotide-binding universal stress UspA family protein
MGTIVCATRIGESSRVIQTDAIQLAKSQGKDIVFLHVVDVSNLGDIDDSLVDAANVELTWLGEALLSVAKYRSRRMGVEADIEIRNGEVREQIETVLKERDADILFLGCPRQDSEQQTFTIQALEDFAQQIRTNTGVEVKLV